jgi:hypothetical protein
VAEAQRGPIAAKLLDSWKSAGSTATRPDDDAEPEPPRRREKEDTGSGSFRLAAGNIALRVRNSGGDLAGKLADAFSNAKAAATVQLEKIFAEIEGEPCEALDPANPFWDFSLEADSGGDFDAGYNDSGGASLHL